VNPKLVRPSQVRLAGRRVFAVSAVVALYTAATFGLLLHLGLHAAIACAAAAAAGVGMAAIAALLLYRADEREKSRRFAQMQLDAAKERAQRPAPAAAPARPKAPTPPPEPGGFALLESRERRESREIQAALLPHAAPTVPGYHIETAYEPCGNLGGDFYDLIPGGDGTLLITLGDVSGKGPAGAIVMAMVQTLFRENADRADGPADLLRRVNRGFAGALGKGVFVTALACKLDPVRHRVTVAGAGHHPLLLLNPAERRTTQVSAPGLALGLVDGDAFRQSLVETTIDLDEGDFVLLYTDGATDSIDEVTKGVGESRLLAAASAAVLGGASGALDRLRTDLWQGGGRRDDSTLLLVGRLAQTARQRAADTRSSLQIMG